MKKSICLFLSIASGLRLKTAPQAGQIAETCSFNLERLRSGEKDFTEYIGTKRMYKDSNFPASRSSLFWSSHEDKS